MSRTDRLALAAGLLLGEHTAARRAFLAWHRILGEAPDAAPDRVWARVSADLSELTCVVDGAGPGWLDVMVSLLSPEGAMPELARLEDVLDSGAVPRPGAWLRLSEAGAEAGWCRATPDRLLPAVAALADHPAGFTISELCDAHADGRTTWLARRTSPGEQRVELRFPLAAAPFGEQAEAAAKAATELGARPVPEVLVGLMADHRPSHCELVLELTEDRISRCGIGVLRPARQLVFELRDVLKAGRDDDLAALEAALDVEGPERVDVTVGAGRLAVDLSYALG